MECEAFHLRQSDNQPSSKPLIGRHVMIESAIDVAFAQLMLERGTLHLEKCLVQKLVGVDFRRGRILVFLRAMLVSASARINGHDAYFDRANIR